MDIYFKGAPRPFGISLGEFIKSCPFVESSPSRISLSCGGKCDLTPPDLYRNYYNNFASKFLSNQPIQEILFPFFCHVVIYFRIQKDDDGCTSFTTNNSDTIPQQYQDEVKEFLKFENHGKYYNLASLLSTQLYIVKCDKKTFYLINEYLNQTKNSSLLKYLSGIITLDVESERVRDIIPKLIFKHESPFKDLNILNAKIREASFAQMVPDLSSIFMSINDNQISKLNTADHSFENLYSHPSAITSMCISNNAKILLSTDINGNLMLFSNGKTFSLNTGISPIWCSSFAPQGGSFTIGSNDKLLRLYDISTQLKPLRLFSAHTSPVTDVKYHPNCSLLGSLAYDPALRIWDIREAATVRIFLGKSYRNHSLCFSPNGKYVAFFDSELVLCDIGTGEVIFKKPLSIESVRHMFFSGDSMFLYIISSKAEVHSFDMSNEDLKPLQICNLNENLVSANFSKSNELVLITFSNNENQLFV